MSQEAREHPEEYRLKELEHKPAPFPKVTSPTPAAPSEQDRESASRLLLEIEKCLFSEDTDHRCTCIEKIMAHVASLRRELDEARRDGKRLKALVAALDAYVEFLSRVEGERAGIIVSHPYMAYRAEDIEEGERLRAIIDAARASKP